MENVNVTQPGYYCYTARFSKFPDLVRIGFFYVKVKHSKPNDAVKSVAEPLSEVKLKNGWKIISGPYQRREHAVDKRYDLPEYKVTSSAPVAQ